MPRGWQDKDGQVSQREEDRLSSWVVQDEGSGLKGRRLILRTPFPYLLIVLTIASCRIKMSEVQGGLLTFIVTIEEGETGTSEEPIPFSRDGLHYSLRIEALDYERERLTDYEGPARVEITTGEIHEGDRYIEFVQGLAENIKYTVRLCNGKTYFWIQDDDQGTGTYATGLSQPIYFDNPTIRDIQESDSVDTSLLEGYFIDVKIEDRWLVVTGVFSDGFYLTDMEDEAWNSIFVYNYNFPEGARRGRLLTSLSGKVGEFYGFTELSYPNFEFGGEMELPAPTLLTSCDVLDELFMESLESSLVRIEDVTVEDMDYHYYDYGEWAVRLKDDCGGERGLLYIYSMETILDFDPEEHVGETIDMIQGNLRNYAGYQPYLWIIWTRDEADLKI